MKREAMLLGLTCALTGCGEDTPGPVNSDHCGFDLQGDLRFTSVERVSSSGDSCPLVTAEDVNGADEPDCDRALRGCDLRLSCSFVPEEGLEVSGRGLLTLGDAGALSGRVTVDLFGLECFYDVTATLD